MARVALAAALLCACTQTVDLIDLPRDAAVSAAPDLRLAPALDLASPIPDERVADRGQLHFGDDGSADDCAASIAAASLRQALCACTTLSPNGVIATTSIDSSGVAVDPLRFAAVASNRAVALQAAFPLDVGGALYAIDSFTTTGFGNPNAATQVRESLHVEGAVDLSSWVMVSGDAWIGGSINGPLTLADGSKYHLVPGSPYPAGEHAPPDAGVGAGSQRVLFDYVASGPPCDCDTGTVPVAALVAARATDNDNAAAGLHPDDLAGIAAPRHVTLPAGFYYLSSIYAGADLTLDVSGPVALFVDGAVTLVGALDVKLADGASLDLLVGGELSTAGGAVGTSDAPARFRIWSGSSGKLWFNARTTIGAAIHAPAAQLYAPMGLDLRGAALVNDVELGGGLLDITFDRALLAEGNRACGTTVVSPLQ